MSSIEEQEYFDDPKYRSYAAQVEKVLKNFEYSAEWADLISALVKLNKVLLANPSYQFLPKRITIGKRLSQCLHPALPGGVHIKALDVYDTIFKIIGHKRLKVDLCIYGAGIFSLLANASMQVRPVLLNVYETHLLPLGEHLRTSLDGLLLGVLPGLEEGSEHFDRINLLLDKIAKSVGLQFFYSSIWRCVLSSPSSSVVRLAAMQLVLRQFDKRKMTDDQLYLIGLDVDMMVQAVCEALLDDNVLTQRATLDVLVMCFPLSSLPVSRTDVKTILSSALYILLRRDMSLNRRLYSWVLGTDVNKGMPKGDTGISKSATRYFEQNAKAILIDALLGMIKKLRNSFVSCCCGVTLQSVTGCEVKFLRVLISLLDRSEVGPVIINDILTSVLKLVEKVSKKYSKVLSPQGLCCKKCLLAPRVRENCTKAQSEFVKSVNLFVSSFETDFIWSFAGEKFGTVCTLDNEIEDQDNADNFTRFSYYELCNIIETLLHIISIETYVEIQTVFLPEMLMTVFNELTKNCHYLTGKHLVTGLTLCLEIMKHIQPFQPGDLDNHNGSEHNIISCAESFKEFLISLITTKILTEKNAVESFIPNLRKKSPYISFTTGYEMMLKHPDEHSRWNDIQFKSYGEDNDTMLQAFKDSCKLLVDICCFPQLRTGNHANELKQEEDVSEARDLPNWFMSLIACACCSQQEQDSSLFRDSADDEYFSSISISACTTVLELMALTLGNDSADISSNSDNMSSVISVVVPPPLLNSHLKWLHEESNFFDKICQILWRNLDKNNSKSTEFDSVCARLLVLLHQLCPDETVERLMVQDILAIGQNHRVQAIEKFRKLWHYMRDSIPHSQVRGNKTFSRCLFAILDQLVVDRYSLHPDLASLLSVRGHAVVSTTVSTWLQHVLEEGDICRILEPYILILLHSQTHRKSLQSVLQHKKEFEDSGIADDQYDQFLQKRDEHTSEDCDSCLEIQRRNKEDVSSLTSTQNFSIDSVMTYALCEVHQQMVKEKNRYEHLVAVLTLSDELEDEVTHDKMLGEKNLKTWVVNFVDMVIQQGIRLYQSEIGPTQVFDISRSVSDGSLPSVHQMGLEAVENNYSSSDSVVSQAAEAIELNHSMSKSQNPLYEHILIYQENFDASRVLYALQGIKNVISVHPGVFTHAACTTSLSSSESPYSFFVRELLVRHERAIYQDQSFYQPTTPNLKGAMKNRMLIEVLISVCLYYMRSSFHVSRHKCSEYTELNHEVQCMATELLRAIVKELTLLTQQDESTPSGQSNKLMSTSKQLSAYIVSVLQRQQVQSSLLTCLLTTIFAIKDLSISQQDSLTSVSGTEINSNSEDTEIGFPQEDKIIKSYLGGDMLQATTLFSHFLRLTFDLVKLEHFAFPVRSKTQPKMNESTPGASILLKRQQGPNAKKKIKRPLRLISHLLSVSHHYDSDFPIAGQRVFISTITEIYKLDNNFDLHQECSTLLKTSLPFLGTALSDVVTPIVLSQCLNLENVVKWPSCVSMPPDYIESSIKMIAALTHYCLLSESHGRSAERTSAEPGPADNVSVNTSKISQMSAASSSIGSGLSTLLNVFNASSSSKSNATNNEVDWSDGLMTARVSILNNLARVVSCMCLLWKDLVSEHDHASVSSEKSKSVSYNIHQLLGPLAMQYGEYLLVAFALVWQNREQGERGVISNGKSDNNVLVDENKELKFVIDVMMAIKLLSIEMFFSLVKQVLKSPPPISNDLTSVTLQESLLQMLLFYVRRQKSAVLSENWSGFLSIMQETLALGTAQTPNTTALINPVSPNSYFLLLYLLSEYVKRANPFTQKKEQRELQDIAGKCIEACNFIAGSSLEQSTWMRRNVSVLPGPQVPEGAVKTHKKTESQSSLDFMEPSQVTSDVTHEAPVQTSSSDTLLTSMANKPGIEIRSADDTVRPETAKERPTSLPQVSNAALNTVSFRNSVKALTVLSEVVANLLDVVYSSEEKEKVLPVLTSIMANVTPYLRNHSSDNVPSFCACVAFLSSISGFQHTRRAWRKDVIELFLDTPFFHMPMECMTGWQTIIDNLMTHDKTSFKEVMSRMNLSRSGPSAPSLNIFSNKEQELELRALHIKRLAFIVFSSEVDQYQKQLPEIQERLAESLRFTNVPGLQCQVFLCFRVLLLRISPHSLTSLWPTIFTELVHVMLQLEQSLNPAFLENDTKLKSKQKSSRNHSPTSPQAPKTVMTCWLNMYLSACKLLDLALCLPVEYVPQFQLYRWSFVGEAPSEPQRQSPPPQPHFQTNGPTKDTKEEEEKQLEPTFVPHCVRIQRLFSSLLPNRSDKTLQVVPEKPLLNITRLKSIEQLQLFFNTITSPLHLFSSQTSSAMNRSRRKVDSSEPARVMPMVEKALQRDFVRPML